MSGSRGPGGRTSRQGRPRRPLCLSARICFIVISLAGLPCGVAVDAEPDVAGLALRSTLRAAAAAGVTRRCIGSGIFDSRHAGTTVLPGHQGWCRGLGRRGPGRVRRSPRLRGVELDVHGEQVGVEHAHGDRVQCAPRVPGKDVPLAGERITVWTCGGDTGLPAVAQPGAQPHWTWGRAGCYARSRRGCLFGDDLERVALTAVADRNPADLAAGMPPPARTRFISERAASAPAGGGVVRHRPRTLRPGPAPAIPPPWWSGSSPPARDLACWTLAAGPASPPGNSRRPGTRSSALIPTPGWLT